MQAERGHLLLDRGRIRCLRSECWFLLDILVWLLSLLLGLATRLLLSLLLLPTPHNTYQQQTNKQSFHGSTW